MPSETEQDHQNTSRPCCAVQVAGVADQENGANHPKSRETFRRPCSLALTQSATQDSFHPVHNCGCQVIGFHTAVPVDDSTAYVEFAAVVAARVGCVLDYTVVCGKNHHC